MARSPQRRLGAEPPRALTAAQALVDLVGGFAGRDILVVGDAIVDSYLRGTATRICREAPVPVISVHDRDDVPGGAANAAANVAALGARPRLLTVIGDDVEGDLLVRILGSMRVETSAIVREPGRRTAASHRLLADGQIVARFDQGSPGPPGGAAQEQAARAVLREASSADAVLVSDYRGAVLTPVVVRALRRSASRRARPVVLDARSPQRLRSLAPTVVTPSFEEAAAALAPIDVAHGGARAEAIERHGDRLLRATGAQMAAVTLDRDGAVLLRPHDVRRVATRPRTAGAGAGAGAGDSFAAALTLALAAGADPLTATELGVAAGAVAVTKEATAPCSAAELLREVLTLPKQLADARELEATCDLHRRAGRRIVFANGCFDLLHDGHVRLLTVAKTLGEVLIVALNSDASVRRLKGPGRPVTDLHRRISVLAELSCVDHVVAFEDDTPAELLRAARPDVLVKGSDYRLEAIPEAPLVEALGGRVEILPCVPDRSTSGIIDRIRAGT